MQNKKLAMVCDRGGHLHDALKLLEQLEISPFLFLTTPGPDVEALRTDPRFKTSIMVQVPQSFSWFGKLRVFNPFKALQTCFISFWAAVKYRPQVVISTGASNVIAFCLFSKIVGATVIHVENLAQVKNASVTGRVLYWVSDHFFVQWEDLLKQYGPKAKYKGWVL